MLDTLAPDMTQHATHNTQYAIRSTQYVAGSTAAILSLESRYTSGVYPKRPLVIVQGEGAHVWDAEGREYIDCVAGQGAANLGHAHPAIVEAISCQAAALISCPEIFYNDQRARLLERLVAVAPTGPETRVFLCNSGAEANEAAFKFARLSTGRIGIVAAMRSFHGRTFGALSATWNKEYRQPFEPLVPGFSHVPYNDIPALEAAVGDNTAAVILEVVQGEGGVHPGTAEYLGRAQELCRERGALLILDEVQTGYGRTGKLFACQHYGLTPDLMTVAKSMAGGLPMAACLIGPRVQNIRPLMHGSTFGGNPLACAAALTTIEALTTPFTPLSLRGKGAGGLGETLPQRAARLGEGLQARLRAINSPLIREVRGLGLMIGIDLRVKVTPILQRLQALGILALPAGPTVLRLLPPLVIAEEDLERVADAIEQVLTEASGPHNSESRLCDSPLQG
ncbi:MAG: aspartate aminotransferase family protein [Anaerolineae bacterium]